MNKELTIKSIPESITAVENFIEEVCTHYDVGPDVYGNILISLTEAVNNAIIHGNKNDEVKDVVVSQNLDTSIKSLVFKVNDEGNGFDYNNLPDPTAPENLTMIGGRGVFLIKQLADFVVFSNDGSTIELQFKV
ncbi:MAG: ATP-binding protein [Chitinophagales bacterium]